MKSCLDTSQVYAYQLDYHDRAWENTNYSLGMHRKCVRSSLASAQRIERFRCALLWKLLFQFLVKGFFGIGMF